MRPWRPTASEALFEHPLVSLERQRVTAAPGEERDVLVLRFPDWVNVIALDPAHRVVFVRQWRYGVAAPTLEIPGGVVDRGETHREAAARELLEETGYRAGRWRQIGAVTPNPALQSNRCITFLATELEWVEEPRGDGEEEIVVELVPRSVVDGLISAGEIDHALVVAAFHALALDERA